MQVACLIPDDAVFQEVRTQLLERHFVCTRFATDVALLRGLHHATADVVLIDVGWASAQEAHFLSWLACRHEERIPVVMQIVDAHSTRVARALEAGAADVLTRGMDAVEMAARLQAAVRRHRGPLDDPTLRVCGFELNRAFGRLLDCGVDVPLTTREFTLAWLLFSHLGDCVSRRTISVTVWGVETDISNRTMEQHTYSLRKKLGLEPSRGLTLRAVYGKGYQLTRHKLSRVGTALGQDGVERRFPALAWPAPC
jgi:DNA-binding response OmpR family regulator